MNYGLAYRLGFHPWEDAADHPPFVDTLSELLTREEHGRTPPFGRALDLGTGSAIWAVELARRGWHVTGVDIVDRALARGRARVEEAGVDVQLVRNDVTSLDATRVGSGYDLLLDSGTFHDFSSQQRAAMGRSVTAVAAPDATLLLLVWPRRRRPLIRGANREDVEVAFPEWTITDIVPSHFELPAILEPILRPDEHWYRLQRLG